MIRTGIGPLSKNESRDDVITRFHLSENGFLPEKCHNKLPDNFSFLNMDPKLVAKMIKRHAFSGGRDTMEDHKKYGGNIRVDICYQYLTFILESDAELREIAEKYTSGELGSEQLKQFTAELIADEIRKHQDAKKLVTDEVVARFFDPNRELDIGGCHDRPELDLETGEHIDYDNYGINFDRAFGLRCKGLELESDDTAE